MITESIFSYFMRNEVLTNKLEIFSHYYSTFRMHGSRTERLRLVTTPQCIPQCTPDVTATQSRFQCFVPHISTEVGRCYEEAVLCPQVPRHDAEAAATIIHPLPVTFPQNPHDPAEMHLLRQQVIDAIRGCKSSDDLHHLYRLFSQLACRVDAGYFSLMLLKAVGFQQLALVRQILSDMQQAQFTMDSNTFQHAITLCISNVTPLIACVCVNASAEPLGPEHYQYIMGALGALSAYNHDDSLIVRTFLLRTQDLTYRWHPCVMERILQNLIPCAYTGDFMPFVVGIAKSKAIEPLVELVSRKVLDSVTDTKESRLRNALQMLPYAKADLFAKRMIVDKLFALADAANLPMHQIMVLSLLFGLKTLSNAQMLRVLEMIANMQDSVVLFAQKCFAKVILDNTLVSSSTDSMSIRCALFHHVARSFVDISKNEKNAKCIRIGVEKAHIDFATKILKMGAASFEIILFPLSALRNIVSSLEWHLDERTELKLLSLALQAFGRASNVKQDESKEEQSQVPFAKDFVSIKSSLDDILSRAINAIAKENNKSSLHLSFHQNIPPTIAKGTVLVFDTTALASILRTGRCNTLEAFMQKNRDKQAMNVVVPFAALLKIAEKLLYKEEPLNTCSQESVSHFLDTLCRWSTSADWFHVLSSSVTLETCRESLFAQNSEGQIPSEIMHCAQSAEKIRKIARRTILIVDSLLAEYAYSESLSVKPVLQLTALLARGKGGN